MKMFKLGLGVVAFFALSALMLGVAPRAHAAPSAPNFGECSSQTVTRVLASKTNQSWGFGGVYSVYLEGKYDRYAGDFCGTMRARATATNPAGGVTAYLSAVLIDGAGRWHSGPTVTVSPGTTQTSSSGYFSTSCGSADMWLSLPGGGYEDWTATVCP